MQRILSLIARNYSKTLAYRSEALLWVLLDSLPMVVRVIIFLYILQDGTSIGGYTLSQLISYSFIATLINSITASHFEPWRVEEIRTGKIDFYLTKPLSYLQHILFGDLGGKLVYLSFALPSLVVVYGLTAYWLQLELLTFSWTQAAFFLLLVLFGYVVEFCIAMIIVLLGFWFEGSEGLEHFKWIIVTLFSGALLPISLLPDWLKTLTQFSPFQYMYHVPIAILQGKASLDWGDILYAASFIAVLMVVINSIWERARRHYAGAGG